MLILYIWTFDRVTIIKSQKHKFYCSKVGFVHTEEYTASPADHTGAQAL